MYSFEILAVKFVAVSLVSFLLYTSGIITISYLFLFGSMYLSLPIIVHGQVNITLRCVPYIVSLAIIPTTCGFYCTSKALSLIEASKVQLFEMIEPFFATILAYIILGQLITAYDLIAGILIMSGLLILEISAVRIVIKNRKI